jgi:hypothetical protein
LVDHTDSHIALLYVSKTKILHNLKHEDTQQTPFAHNNNTALNATQSVNSLTPELNPSAQRCLTRFFTGDFVSLTVHFVNVCVKNQQMQ